MNEFASEWRQPATPTPSRPRQETAARAVLDAMSVAHRRDYAGGSVVKLAGDETTSILAPLSGWLLVSKTMADGQRQIIDVILPGEILDPASADPTKSALDIEALGDATIAMIPRRDWRRACKEHPELAEMNHRMIAAALSRMSERMLRLGKAPAETRIAYAFCELCLRSSTRGLIEGRFRIPMTQQQLGDFCGLSAVHICRTLRRLDRTGVLSVSGSMDIAVHDVDALAAIADIDAHELFMEIIWAA